MPKNPANLLADNLHVLRQRHPELAAAIEDLPERGQICFFKARDGGMGYGLRQAGRVTPLTDPIAPLARLQGQLDMFAVQLNDFTRPVLIVGLYPGVELTGIFDLAESCATPHCPQPIWVCLDSLACLYGFLCSWDARKILAAPRVTFFQRAEMPERVEWLRRHPEFPHLFTLISGAPDHLLNEIMPPLAQLVEERNRETDLLRQANDQYYDAISDRQLADIIAAASPPASDFNLHPSALASQPSAHASRPPRLLMPTCTWSTYIQHSARDTSAAFERLGWEARVLNMDAMLTPYHLVRQINEFKPDVFLFIDHLRSEAEELYPRNMLFVTWVQDEMGHLFCEAAGRKLTEYAARGRRDLVIGYVERFAKEFGYPADRLVALNIPANPAVFHPVTLTPAERGRFGCDLAFMSNSGMSSGQVLEEKIIPYVAPLGISPELCMRIHDDLWARYRAGDIMADRIGFNDWLMQYPAFAGAWTALRPAGAAQTAPPQSANATRAGAAANDPRQDEVLRLFHWRLNDTVYRHVVVEWADELGLDLHLHGHGWETHPRFKKYARGILQHGPALNIAYQSAKFNLHLNITGGMHQRLWEIVTAGARPLTRVIPASAANRADPPPAVMRALARQLLAESTAGLAAALERAMSDPDTGGALAGWVFNIAMAMARAEPAAGAAHEQDRAGHLAGAVLGKIEALIMNRPEWILADWDRVSFSNRASFAAIFDR